MFRKIVVLSLLAAAAALMAVAAGAQGPQPSSPRAALGTAFTYQGQLRQNGAPLNGSVNLTFKLYDVSSGGSPLGTVSKPVTATGGLFTTLLDFGSLFNGGERWLGIAVGADPELAPRQALTAVPYALYAGGNWGLSGNAGTSPGANFVGTSDNQPLVFKTNGAEAMRIDSAGRLGIGTSTPSDALTVQSGAIRAARTLYADEGFEGVSFPPAGWTTGGNANWVRATGTAYQGAAAASAILSGAFQGTWLNLNYTAPKPGLIRFFWKAHIFQNQGFLLFCVDNPGCSSAGGGYQQMISGIVDWTEVIVPVTAGPHNFRWLQESGMMRWLSPPEQTWLDRVQYTADGSIIAEDLLSAARLDVSGRSNFWGTESNFWGKVGIGVTNPLQLLHMNVGPGMGEGMQIDSAIAGHSPAIYLNHTGNGGHNFRIASYGDNVNPGSFRIRDDSSGEDRIVIDALGRVGINTSELSRTLEVNGAIGVYDSNFRNRFGGIATEVGARLINFGINEDSARRFGDYDSNSQGGMLRVDTRAGVNLFQFLARPAGSAALINEVMDISSSGNVGIGNNAPTNILQIQQNSVTDPIADAWTVYSSRRWKSSIATIPDALDKVTRLRGVSYDWTANGKHDIGLIAEEVGQVVPEVVAYEDNGVDARSVDYARLVALLVESTKEQQRQIEAQREQIASLEARVGALEQRAPDGSRPSGEGALELAGVVTSGNISLAALLAMGVVYVFRRRKTV